MRSCMRCEKCGKCERKIFIPSSERTLGSSCPFFMRDVAENVDDTRNEPQLFGLERLRDESAHETRSRSSFGMRINVSVAAIALCVAIGPQGLFAKTVARTFVTTARATDAGIDVSPGQRVRVSAEGTIALQGGGCPAQVDPDGCTHGFSLVRQDIESPVGALVGAFATRTGHLTTTWFAVGKTRLLSVPNGAERLVFRINGSFGRPIGAFRVFAGVTNAGVSTSVTVRRQLANERQVVNTATVTRAMVQAALRRFGFSASPAEISAVYRSGLHAWFTSQLAPSTIDDSAATAYIQPPPINSGQEFPNDGGMVCAYDTELIDAEVSSKRQLLEKMTTYWLQHFSLNEYTADPGPFGEYVQTIHNDALGNFAKLVSDVAVQPDMLSWLGNAGNNGSNPAKPPNQNFGRELMQIYTMGPNALNIDGSQITDAAGNPVPAYSQSDIDAVSLALTGYNYYIPNPFPLGDPRSPSINIVTFSPQAHGKGPYTILGRSVADPGDATVASTVVAALVSSPSTAPFEAHELLARLVTENPSPGYISRIAAVWAADVNDPHQIADVISAIVTDPEYLSSLTQPMLKETDEFYVDAIRALGGENANPVTTTSSAPLQGVRLDLEDAGQFITAPPTVFGFYTVGDKESLISNASVLERDYIATRVSNAMRLTPFTPVPFSAYNTNDSFNLDATKLATMTGAEVADYLVDALVSTSTPELRSLVRAYVGNDPTKAPGAAYIILTSPEYEAN